MLDFQCTYYTCQVCYKTLQAENAIIVGSLTTREFAPLAKFLNLCYNTSNEGSKSAKFQTEILSGKIAY